MIPSKSTGHAGKYQTLKPVTDKNIGKKIREGSFDEDKGTGAAERRRKQQEKQALKNQMRQG